MVEELNRLIGEAAAARAADPRFLSDLRDLARRHGWQWRRRVAFDDFADGNHTANPVWKVAGGEFRVSARDGMRTHYRATAAPPSGGSGGEADIGAVLLGTILQQMTRPRGRDDRGAPAPAGPPRIRLGAKIPNAFAIRLSLASATVGRGRIEIGVTRGGSANGYRLAYSPGAARSVELLRVGRRGMAVIDTGRDRAKLEDGRLHTVLLTRDDRGEIAVSIDGKEVIRTVDRGFHGAFDGVIVINKGGDYTIRSIAVYGAG